jgi:membrane associated rhomboid family serine protease
VQSSRVTRRGRGAAPVLLWHAAERVLLPIRDHNPRERFPVATLLIVALNVVAFLFELANGPREQAYLVQAAGAIPYELVHHVDLRPTNLVPWPATIWTSMFLHGGFMHLIGNMWFLWLFGDNVEDALGHWRYLAFYLLAGIAAAAAQVAISPFSIVPMVGASGAIAGVLAAYVSLYPRAAITVLNPIPLLWIFFGLFFDLPAWIVIAEFFIVNLVNGVSSTAQATGGAGGVAFFAHLGGFVAGLFLVRIFMSGPPRSHDRWSGFQPSGRPRAAEAGRRPWDA